MSDVEKRFHETWLGMVQPVEGLVVSVPALVAAQCMERQGIETQRLLHALCPPQIKKSESSSSSSSSGSSRELDSEPGPRRIAELSAFLAQLLDYDLSNFDSAEALPEALSLYVAEGQQMLRPSMALRKLDAPGDGDGDSEGDGGDSEGTPRLDDSTPASRAGAPYSMLVWQLPEGLELDKAETQTGPWHYPPTAKFDRLLRECRVPIGLLVNGDALRLMYCPHGESTGAMTFKVNDMAEVGGRPILDAFVMLLGEQRMFGVEAERALPAILADSRARQADVTDALANQLFEALGILLAGFEAAAEREESTAERLREALATPEGNQDQLYGGLLTLLLRLVFLLYAEDRDLLPTEHPTWANLSVLALYDELQADHALHPDTMGQRFGAYPRLLAAFRAVFYGVHHGELYIPPRHGALFDPERYPFLEGWVSGGAPVIAEERAALRVPSLSDDAVYRVLERLLILGGQRLSYRALEVEQIGSVYEALMGYHVQRVPEAAVCLRPARVWVTAAEVLNVAKGQRVKWLQARGLSKSQATKLNKALSAAKTTAEALEALLAAGMKKVPLAGAQRLVIQPGEERRRTSSHYTPRSLSEPIVARTLEPLIAAMGGGVDGKGEPSSEQLLRLKVCDPAMGSGAFLVAAVRFLADQVVAAWTREGVLAAIVKGHEDPVMHARRLVAQRCIYGVDKNPFAVNLAKLSLWLETLARGEPFTFVDHALKCGDSLVGLDLEQIKGFDWVKVGGEAVEGKGKKRGKGKKKALAQGKQLDLFEGVIERALLRAYQARRRLLELAEGEGDRAELIAEKEALHEEAELALERARMIGDCVVGAFFAHGKDKARRKELGERRGEVEAWLMGGADAVAPVGVREWVEVIREEVRPFHWWLEFPEVFWDQRADPLEGDVVNHAAALDAFIGNPPFAGKNAIGHSNGNNYIPWLMSMHSDLVGRPNTDLCAYFFRRAHALLGNHGSLGFVATNTISQGDTRLISLKSLIRGGATIYEATDSTPWPGKAAVMVSYVHIAFGRVRECTPPPRLQGRVVSAIDSRLRPKPERDEPRRLRANENKVFMGGKLVGVGLAVSTEEYHQLTASNSANEVILRPYLGGSEVNSRPDCSHERYVIDFTDYSLEAASKWPDLMDIVQAKVKPDRMRDKRSTYKTYWWKPGESGSALYASLVDISQCLVSANVTKHLLFTFQPVSIFFSQTLNVFAFDRKTVFSTLQCRVHEAWARLHSSSMKNDLRYTASDCFETFPFPPDHQLTTTSPLEDIGERLYTTRAQHMIDTNLGLTKTYNALKDPDVTDPAIVHLRELHIQMDRTVLAAYGWSDIDVPPYTTPVTAAEKAARQAFEDEIIDRLFVLNAERAAEERKLGAKQAKGKKKSKKKTGKKKAKQT